MSNYRMALKRLRVFTFGVIEMPMHMLSSAFNVFKSLMLSTTSSNSPFHNTWDGSKKPVTPILDMRILRNLFTSDPIGFFDNVKEFLM